MGENREMLRSMNTILRVNKMALRGSLRPLLKACAGMTTAVITDHYWPKFPSMSQCMIRSTTQRA